MIQWTIPRCFYCSDHGTCEGFTPTHSRATSGPTPPGSVLPPGNMDLSSCQTAPIIERPPTFTFMSSVQQRQKPACLGNVLGDTEVDCLDLGHLGPCKFEAILLVVDEHDSRSPAVECAVGCQDAHWASAPDGDCIPLAHSAQLVGCMDISNTSILLVNTGSVFICIP